jgi:hypothetical protein
MNRLRGVFVSTTGMPRVFLGWILCCSFFTAQTHAQGERLHRAQSHTPSATQCNPEQPQHRTDHLGCSTTRALKPSQALAWIAPPGARASAPIFHDFIVPPSLRAEPLPERAAKRPVLRI